MGGSLAEQGRSRRLKHPYERRRHWESGEPAAPAHQGPRAAAGEVEASPQPRSPHAAPPHPLRGSPLPAAGRWKPMMRLIRSSEFMSSFLRRSSARRWDAESPAGAPGAVGTAPAPPSAIPGTAGPPPRARPAQRAGAGTARLRPLKRAPPFCVGAGEGAGALGERSARSAVTARRPHLRWPPRPQKWRHGAMAGGVRPGTGGGGAEGTRGSVTRRARAGAVPAAHTGQPPALALHGAHWGNINRLAPLTDARATGIIEQGAYWLISSSPLCTLKVHYTSVCVPGDETATLLFPYLNSPQTKWHSGLLSALSPSTAPAPNRGAAIGTGLASSQSLQFQNPGPGQLLAEPQATTGVVEFSSSRTVLCRSGGKKKQKNKQLTTPSNISTILSGRILHLKPVKYRSQTTKLMYELTYDGPEAAVTTVQKNLQALRWNLQKKAAEIMGC